MPAREFVDRELWEKLYEAEETQIAEGAQEHSWTDGEDGEGEFDRRALAKAKGRNVIDVGCGSGEFTLQMAAIARRVSAIDFSTVAIKKAMDNIRSHKPANVEFRLTPADNLPFPRDSFDLAISRRGPATDTSQSLAEVHRVLKTGGVLLTQEIGERDKQNWITVFGRGQMYPGPTSVAVELEKRLAQAGFRDISIEEFEAKEYFATVQDALIRLENSPIIPDFDREHDAHHVQEIVERFTTPKGIVTNTHRVLIDAMK